MYPTPFSHLLPSMMGSPSSFYPLPLLPPTIAKFSPLALIFLQMRMARGANPPPPSPSLSSHLVPLFFLFPMDLKRHYIFLPLFRSLSFFSSVYYTSGNGFSKVVPFVLSSYYTRTKVFVQRHVLFFSFCVILRN